MVDLDRFTVCTKLNIIDRDLAANRPDPIRILDVENITNHSPHTDRANSTGGAVAWLLKLQSKMLGDAYLLQCFTGTVTI